MTKHVSRRAALASAAVASVAAAVPALALASTNADAELLALYREWRALRYWLDEVSTAEWSRAHDSLPEWAQTGEDQRGEVRGFPDMRSAPEWERLFSRTGISSRASRKEIEAYTQSYSRGPKLEPKTEQQLRDKLAERLRVWEAFHRAQKELEERCGIPAIEAKSEAEGGRLVELERAIVRTPAHTAAGIAAKLRMVAFHAWEIDPDAALPKLGEPGDLYEDTAISALLDLERMAGRAQA